jgi:NADPH-dependent curcumin reductase CurA
LISSAAGAVGMIAGQIAKSMGCRVVGIAGSDEKCEFLQELGFDETINYKALKSFEEDFLADVVEKCPRGVDIYFDNVSLN